MGFGCRMLATETAAYDPIFFLHHSFVEKVFVDWQNLHHMPEELQKKDEILAPFNNSTYNPFDLTRITSRQTWDYKQNLCYATSVLSGIIRLCRNYTDLRSTIQSAWQQSHARSGISCTK